ncbi:MAG: phosphoglucomutase [Thermosediminibacterales bacterium]|nr:phosphoglucomutase [Thermosediminibacterales bacterium]MDK2836369.1 phosphoglucomutase [Thermosediminibacterales bacterium]
MDYLKKYSYWLTDSCFDEDTKRELLKIKGDKKEIEDRFYKDLEFGTGGMRGVIGAGTNRINKYTVRKATQGLANFILDKSNNGQDRGAVIAYDSRHKSDEFALETALVLNGNGIKAYLFEDLRPTPELSFAVRLLGAAAGVMITASHNPAEYNGYKVYWEDGGQAVPSLAGEITKEISKITDYSDIKTMSREEAEKRGLLKFIGKEVDDCYIEKVKSLCLRPEVIKQVGDEFKIVYTPFHGTGNVPVRRVLTELGFKNVIVVKEQELPDPDFSTVKYPNPEEHEAFELAVELAEKENADIIFGTDPDCDRVGVVVKNREGCYVVLTGNQTGALLLDYILSAKKEKGELPDNGVMVKTIVTSEMGRAVADYYGVETVDTLTGFKFIGEKIKEFEEKGDKQFLFGYEESYGYLAGTFVRDKDAVIASMLIAEMALYYKSKGMTLYDALINLFERFGYYKEGLESLKLEGKDGSEKMKHILNGIRQNPPKFIGGKKVTEVRDYLRGNYNLPKSNVLYFKLDDESWFCIRPSGTEPKIKVYFSVKGANMEEADKKFQNLKKSVMKLIG